jgi:hypothetical protein
MDLKPILLAAPGSLAFSRKNENNVKIIFDIQKTLEVI